MIKSFKNIKNRFIYLILTYQFKKFFKIVSTRNWGETFSNLLKAPDSYGAFNGILDKIKVKDEKLHKTLIRNALKAISSLEAENKQTTKPLISQGLDFLTT